MQLISLTSNSKRGQTPMLISHTVYEPLLNVNTLISNIKLNPTLNVWNIEYQTQSNIQMV